MPSRWWRQAGVEHERLPADAGRLGPGVLEQLELRRASCRRRRSAANSGASTLLTVAATWVRTVTARKSKISPSSGAHAERRHQRERLEDLRGGRGHLRGDVAAGREADARRAVSSPVRGPCGCRSRPGRGSADPVDLRRAAVARLQRDDQLAVPGQLAGSSSSSRGSPARRAGPAAALPSRLGPPRRGCPPR